MGGQAPTRDLVTQATNLRHLVVQELLSAETGFDGHDQHHVELVEDVENRFDRLGGTHGEACLAAHVTQLAGQTHRRVGGAHMERDGGGTELRVFRGPTVGVLDHQVHVDRQVGDLADALDDGSPRVRFGTKWWSITSTCTRSALAMALRSRSRLQKSAERMLGAICMLMTLILWWKNDETLAPTRRSCLCVMVLRFSMILCDILIRTDAGVSPDGSRSRRFRRESRASRSWPSCRISRRPALPAGADVPSRRP